MPNTQKKIEVSESTQVHDTTNCWFDGKQWIPVAGMSDQYLRAAKLYAQKKQEFFFIKTTEYSDRVEMFDNEAERRGIKIRDFKSSFHKNTRKLKTAIKNM